MTTEEDTRQIQLSSKDRCDACGSQAYVMVILPAGGTLYFCNHHSEQHAPGLAIAGAEFYRDAQLLAGLTASRLVDEDE